MVNRKPTKASFNGDFLCISFCAFVCTIKIYLLQTNKGATVILRA